MRGRYGAGFGGFAVAVTMLWLAGCAALDELAVAQTHRLEEGEFYVPGTAPGPTVTSVVVLPVRLDPELANSLSYGRRAGEFAPLIAAIDEALARQSCCVHVLDPALPAGAPHVYVGSAVGEMAPAEAGQQVLPHDRIAPMVLHSTPSW